MINHPIANAIIIKIISHTGSRTGSGLDGEERRVGVVGANTERKSICVQEISLSY